MFAAPPLALLGLIVAVLLGAAGLRGLFQAEHLAREFAERLHPDSMAVAALRGSLDELQRVGQPMPAESNRAAWSRLVGQARARAHSLGESRPAVQAALAGDADAALARLASLADTSSPDTMRQQLDGSRAALQALAASLRDAAEANDAARQQATRAAYTLFAAALLLATGVAGWLARRRPVGPALLRDPDQKPYPDDVPTLHPEVVTPDYCGIERRGPDRPQNIVRAAFSGKATPASARAGQESADDRS